MPDETETPSLTDDPEQPDDTLVTESEPEVFAAWIEQDAGKKFQDNFVYCKACESGPCQCLD